MVAHGDPFERQFTVFLGNHDEAEIRSAAADVAHENEIVDLDSAAPGITLAFKPRVKSCLGLFQQRDVLIACLFGGAPCLFTGFFVERSRHSEQHVLFRKRQLPLVPCFTAVPHGAQVLQELR